MVLYRSISLVFSFVLGSLCGVGMLVLIVGSAQTAHAQVLEILQKTELAQGIVYRHLIVSSGHSRHSLRVVELDRTKSQTAVRVFKAQNLYNGLEPLAEIAERVSAPQNVPPRASTARVSAPEPTLVLNNVLNNALNNTQSNAQRASNHLQTSTANDATNGLTALINANLWSAGSNTSIGPTVADGEVVELAAHKQWSSCFFDAESRMVIDRFALSGTVRLLASKQTQAPINSILPNVLPIISVNRRSEASGIVLYNRFAGASVPFSASLNADDIERETLENIAAEADETDIKPSSEQIKRIVAARKRANQAELPLTKVVAVYTKPPAINEEISCKVIAVTQGVVSVPENGIVLSLSHDVLPAVLPKVGASIAFTFTTSIHADKRFVNAVCGVPRLVRDGVAAQEATSEGATSKRFIKGQVRRTALGVSENGNTLFFVVADSFPKGVDTPTLAELALCMKTIGAHNAMNLDGGGSSCMIIRPTNPANQVSQANQKESLKEQNKELVGTANNSVRVATGLADTGSNDSIDEADSTFINALASRRKIAVALGLVYAPVRTPAKPASKNAKANILQR